MTIDQMRAILGLAPSVSDAAVEAAYLLYIEGQPQAEEPVSLAEAKRNMRVTADDEDQDILGMITAARALAERYTGLVLTARTVTETFDIFGSRFALRSWPVRSVLSVDYADVGGMAAALGPSAFRAALGNRPARLVPALGTRWPRVAAAPGSIEVTLEAGYATPEDVPGDIKRALLLAVSHFYDDRSATELPAGVFALLRPYRLRRV